MARAFDTVHGQALRLAADQAALQSNVSSMFVNLSRRSQALVERQLQLIEQLESNEQDPDQLSNLFQLDHLATRMRRNSENLLVLAGTDLAKRNVAPVPLVDVLRAAVSEIEQYQRIVVQAPPQATVVGRATSDVIHLLAELLDNATNFSPPDSQVVMSSLRAQDGSIVVEIADSGVGMADHELADANRRLATPSAVDVSASRRMGLFVVGRLGARHGIAVHLGGAPMGGPGGGLTASVTLPAHLVTVSGDRSSRARCRVPAAFGAAQFAPNGVPPQRAGLPNRPMPHATLAMPRRRSAGRAAHRPQRPSDPDARLVAAPQCRPEQERGDRRPRRRRSDRPPSSPSPGFAGAGRTLLPNGSRARAADGGRGAPRGACRHGRRSIDDAHDADAVPTEAVPITPAGRRPRRRARRHRRGPARPDAGRTVDGRRPRAGARRPGTSRICSALGRRRSRGAPRRTPASGAARRRAPRGPPTAGRVRPSPAAPRPRWTPEAGEPAQTAGRTRPSRDALGRAPERPTRRPSRRRPAIDEAEAGEVAAQAGDEADDAPTPRTSADCATRRRRGGRARAGTRRPTPAVAPPRGPDRSERDATAI